MILENAKITFLINENGATIELKDSNSAISFARIKLNVKQLCAAMGRIAYTPCEVELFGLDKVGKKLGIDRLEFEIPQKWIQGKRISNAALNQLALKACPEGWEHDNRFGSQSSFFSKDGKEYARVTIRRWV